MKQRAALLLLPLILIACSSPASTDDADSGGPSGTNGSGSSSEDRNGNGNGTANADANTNGNGNGNGNANAHCVRIEPQSGTIATSIARADATTAGVAWENVAGALVRDGIAAHVNNTQVIESEELRITGFDFSMVPATARIAGVQVELTRKSPDPGTVDGKVRLLLDGNTSPHSIAYEPIWPYSTFGTHVYGPPSETWGLALTPEAVKKSTFGASIWVKRDVERGATSADALIDALMITVHYCL